MNSKLIAKFHEKHTFSSLQLSPLTQKSVRRIKLSRNKTVVVLSEVCQVGNDIQPICGYAR